TTFVRVGSLQKTLNGKSQSIKSVEFALVWLEKSDRNPKLDIFPTHAIPVELISQKRSHGRKVREF
ncbi:MAG: hypothetical protein PUP90_30000, partial [Nostoc sp. S4]|nr:hypothetical protein [Nostoc sp. S4]